MIICYRQSLQCKEATPLVQNKNFTRPPSCARRHLVFDADHDAPFNSIDSGFVDEYIIPKSRDAGGEEQVKTLCNFGIVCEVCCFPDSLCSFC